MSSGKTINVPNIIRTMIPQRIVNQYSQYCKENNFQSFSKSTMLRVLDECSATHRKSLQGLDNFAAQGGRSFDDLGTVVLTISPLKKDGENWAAEMQEVLKVGKLYLKGTVGKQDKKLGHENGPTNNFLSLGWNITKLPHRIELDIPKNRMFFVFRICYILAGK